MSVRFVQRIDELCHRRWNGIATNVPPASYEYLTAMDAVDHRTGSYFVLEDGDDYLCGARLTVLADGRGLRSLLYGRVSAAAGWLGQCTGEHVVCGWSPGDGRCIPVDRSRSEDDRTETLERACDEIERFASGRTVVFPDVLPEDDVLARVLVRRGYGVASGRPVARLDVEWDGIAGYLAVLKRRSGRPKAASEIRRFVRSGAVVERAGPEDARWDAICDLLNRHHERLNGGPGDHQAAGLRRLREALGDNCIVYVSRQDNVLTGASVVVRNGDEARVMFVGIDHAACGDNFTYFNLVFYTPADELAKLGVRRIWLGNAVYDAKLRRGCRILPSRVLVRAQTGLGRVMHAPGFMLQRAWSRRKYARFIDPATP